LLSEWPAKFSAFYASIFSTVVASLKHSIEATNKYAIIPTYDASYCTAIKPSKQATVDIAV